MKSKNIWISLKNQNRTNPHLMANWSNDDSSTEYYLQLLELLLRQLYICFFSIAKYVGGPKNRLFIVILCFSINLFISYFQNNASGEMQEWLNWLPWKGSVSVRVPWVRIPLSPH